MYILVCTEHTSVQMGSAVQLCPYYHCNYELRDYVNTIGGIIEHNMKLCTYYETSTYQSLNKHLTKVRQALTYS